MDSKRIARGAVTALAVVVAAGLVGLFVYVEFVRSPAPTGSAGTVGPTGTVGSAVTAGPPDPLDPFDVDGSAPVTPSAAPPTPASTITGDDRNGGSPAPGAREAAEGFGRALTNVQGGQKAWVDRLAAFLSPRQAALYKNVPVENAPSGTLIRVDLNQLADVVAEAHLTYDTGLVIGIRLAYNAIKWEVVSVVDRVIPGTSPEGAR
jgi:hypothetical protein